MRSVLLPGRAGLERLGLAILPIMLMMGCSRSAAAPSSEEAIPTAKSGPAEAPAVDLQERSFPLLVWTASTVEQEYFDKDRFDPREQLVSAVTLLGRHTPEFFAEVEGDTLEVRVGAKTRTFPLGGLATLSDAADRLETILEFAQGVLGLAEEPLHELEYVAINGLFAPLDPHTILLTPEEHTDLGVRTKGQFGGVGAEIRAEQRRILIVRVLPDMPAAKVGIRDGDILLEIAGESTVNMTAQEAQQLLRGPVGTAVEVKARRGKELLSFSIARDVIRIESVRAEMLPDRVAYLQISAFQEDTADRVQAELEDLTAAEGAPQGLVLDLRGNSGGLLVQATALVDQLVDTGELVIVRSALGREVDPATPGTIVPETASVVVLIDEQSASAAEIVSGSLRALGRGVVVGRSSFGKGTVQMVRPSAPYGRELALKLTIAEYLVSGDQRIQTYGVVPDVVLHPVELTAIPGVVRYYDLERFERQRERSKVAHLPSARHELKGSSATEPVAQLRYLDELGPPGPLGDPEVRLARELAVGLAGASSRMERTTRVSAAALELRQREDARIAAALAEAGIPWEEPRGASPDPELRIDATLAEPGPIAAGEPFTLELAVRNLGSEPAHRVHLITDCVHDELDGIEIAVGRVEPGQVQTREVQMHVMPWHTDFAEELEIDLHVGEPDRQPDAEATVMLEVDGSPRPALSYDYWIVDDPALAERAPARPPSELLPGDEPFVVRGNGDGMLQPGEAVLLAFSARNDGPGAGTDVRAFLRNLTGRQGLLEEGLVQLDALAVGEEKRGAFGLTVSPKADPALPMELELVVGDANLRVRAQDKLRLPIVAARPAFTPQEERYATGPATTALFAAPHPDARTVARLPEGTVLSGIGSFGEYIALGLPGRRLFVQRSAVQPTDEPPTPAAIAPEPAVLPPRIALDAVPQRTGEAAILVRGTATHPRHLRDVVILVRPPGPDRLEQKIAYQAAPAGAKTLTFTTEVPLEPGGNRITILARDGDKVQERRDVWVYREPPEPKPVRLPDGSGV